MMDARKKLRQYMEMQVELAWVSCEDILTASEKETDKDGVEWTPWY